MARSKARGDAARGAAPKRKGRDVQWRRGGKRRKTCRSNVRVANEFALAVEALPMCRCTPAFEERLFTLIVRDHSPAMRNACGRPRALPSSARGNAESPRSALILI